MVYAGLMYLADLADRLEAYRTLSGDARADLAQALLVDFDPLIGEATRVTFYSGGACGTKREWKANARYWFLIYLDDYEQPPGFGAGYFIGYMKKCLTMRLLWERQREALYLDRNQFVDFRPCGGDQKWPPPLLRALRRTAVRIEDEALAFDDADEEQRLLFIVQRTLPERERSIYLAWYYGSKRIPLTSIAEHHGISPSRVGQLKEHAIVTVSKHLAA